MSSPQGECRRQEVGDLEFLFVLFGGEFASDGVPYELRRGLVTD